MTVCESALSRLKASSAVRRSGLVIVLLLLPFAGQISAQQLTTPVMQQGDNQNKSDMPSHGQTKSAVRTTFGDPRKTRGPVGEPPITQWYYEDFVVYFEYDHVIHAAEKPDD